MIQRHQTLGPLLLALLAQPALAAPEGVSTGGCEVFASGTLRSNEYLPTYQGACKNGLAEGAGKAIWKLRYAPDAAPVVWEGRFSQGIFLAEKQIVGAKKVDSTRALLDLGVLDAPKGASAGRLWVESRVDGKLPASACKPLSFQVSANGALTDDALAKAWLTAAYQRWQGVCGAAGEDALKGRVTRIQLHEGTGWSTDANGNIPSGVVQATKSLGGSSTASGEWQSYTNRASQQVAQTKRELDDKNELQANQDRVRGFARKHGATRFVELSALEKNPFRFGSEVLLVAVQMDEARTPVEAFVKPARRARYGWNRVLLRGAIADWDEQGRIVAVQVKGRSTEKETKGWLILEMVGSQRCAQPDCEDYLYMPGRRWLSDESFTASIHQDDATRLLTTASAASTNLAR